MSDIYVPPYLIDAYNKLGHRSRAVLSNKKHKLFTGFQNAIKLAAQEMAQKRLNSALRQADLWDDSAK